MMGSLLQSTKNTRSILRDSFRFLRSDVPDALTEEETAWLVEWNVLTVIDLREESERRRRPCSLEIDDRFSYHVMPVTGGNGVPKCSKEVSESYIRMVDAQMETIIAAIWNAPTNVLYFCNAGKDRTGVVSALLLYWLGMDREYIVQDYLQSRENLRQMLMDFAERNPHVDIRVITPDRYYMEGFLDWLELRG